MRLDTATCRNLFASRAVARLATIGPAGPHLIPIVFATEGDRIVSIVDHKPKRTNRLQRLANLRRDPQASLLVDHYADDWSQLWWVRADAVGRVVEDAAGIAQAVTLLAAKYPVYRSHVPAGPALVFAVKRWSGWAASEEAVPLG